MNRQKIKEMLDERIGQKDAHKLEEYEWIVGLMEMVAYEVECDLGAKNMLLETELNTLKETAESIAEQRDRLQKNLIDKVELNNEWLEKFGFEKYNECFYKIELKRGYSDGWYLSNENELTKSMSEFMIRVKYVHELQNLWFALRGEELILK